MIIHLINRQLNKLKGLLITDGTPPSAPTNFFVSNIADTTVILNWDASTDNIGVTKYRIYNNDVLLQEVQNVTTVNLTGLTTSTPYVLTIRAVDAANNESADSNSESFTTTVDTTAPTPPVNAAVSSITDTTATFTWEAATDNVGVVNYKVFTNAVDSGVLGNVLSFNITGLNPSTQYDFVVKALDAEGNTSGDSNLVSFNTLSGSGDVVAPSIPTNFATSNITQNSVDLTWDASTDNVAVTNYRIFNGGTEIANLGNTNTSYTLTGLTEDTAYALAVRAYDAAGNFSALSNVENITTLASQFTSTRFIMMGDSWTNSMYTGALEAQAVSRINSSFPNETVTVHNEGSPGESITSFVGSSPNVDTALANYNFDAQIDTYCIVMLGINDARVELYEDLTQTEIDDKIAALNYIVDAIEAKGFTPVLIDAPWANFQISGSFPSALGGVDGSYNQESLGTKPYNDNIVHPVILSRTPDYAFPDGESYMQAYVRMYNEHPDITGDGVHPTTYEDLKQAFVDTIVNYIFTGVEPTKIPQVGQSSENPQEEIDYFNAVEVTSADSANLQTLLDTHNSIRLDSGDYSTGGNITIGSNQSLYGFPSQHGTELGSRTITIAQGSTNVLIKDFDPQGIIFEGGSEISNVTINHISKSTISGTNFRLVDSEIINIHNVKLDFDNSSSGYTRNIKVVRAFAQSSPDHVTWKGNDTTPSYGNIELSRNFLSSTTDTAEYDNLETHTLLGTDSEYWDSQGVSNRGPYYFRGCGRVTLFNSFGYSGPALAKEYDIEAEVALLQRVGVSTGNQTPVFRNGTKSIFLWGNRTGPTYEANTFSIEAHKGDSNTDFNGSDLNSTLTGADATTLSSMIYGTQHTPLPKPNFYLPDSPAGANWATDRVGQTDQSAFIQNLIDTNGIAELDEGVYYISQSLLVRNNGGIIGKGTGKTAIVAINDTFPIIKVDDTLANLGESTNQNHILKYLTPQGGNYGYHVLPNNAAAERYMITNNTVNDVVFRNQSSAIRAEQIFGYDNNFFNNVHFVDCGIGFDQIPQPLGNVPNDQDITYVDKTVFYKCQFINCGTALSMATIRANNLNAWVDCLFDGNGEPFIITQSNALYTANSIFRNTTGDVVIGGNSRMSFYGCDFEDNNVTSLFGNRGTGIYLADCNLNDVGVPLFSGGTNNQELYMWHSNVEGTITLSQLEKSMFVNNNITGNSTLSKPMVEVVNGTALTILDGAVNVYPQFLVKH